MFCVDCGKEIGNNDKFCVFCGHTVERTISDDCINIGEDANIQMYAKQKPQYSQPEVSVPLPSAQTMQQSPTPITPPPFTQTIQQSPTPIPPQSFMQTMQPPTPITPPPFTQTMQQSPTPITSPQFTQTMQSPVTPITPPPFTQTMQPPPTPITPSQFTPISTMPAMHSQSAWGTHQPYQTIPAPPSAGNPYQPQKTKKKKGLLIALISVGTLLLTGAIVIMLYPKSTTDADKEFAKELARTATSSHELPASNVPMPEQSIKQPTQAPKPSARPEIFPISFTAFGNNYSISGYEAGLTDDGTIAITIFGTGYEVMPIRGGELKIPIFVKYYSDDDEYQWQSFTINNDQIMFSYDSSVMPETILVTNGDSNEIIVTIDHSDGSATASPVKQPQKPLQDPPTTEPAPESTAEPTPERDVPVALIPIEYIGYWEGSVDDIFLSFLVEPDGTGQYMFEQGNYSEIYDFSLEVKKETFSVQIPEDNELGIKKIGGTYEYSDETLTLNVRTTFVDGRKFEYSVPCKKW